MTEYISETLETPAGFMKGIDVLAQCAVVEITSSVSLPSTMCQQSWVS